MTVRAQIHEMVEQMPEMELPTILEVVRHFMPIDPDDIASAEDLEAHRIAMEEYAAGETLGDDDIDWG